MARAPYPATTFLSSIDVVLSPNNIVTIANMPSEDLKQYATSTIDFYELLGVTPSSSESDIRRAYRRTALKYHPDKNADNPAAVEKFHLLQIANDVLSDAEVKALYDNARTVREAKRRQHELFEGKRRQMKEDLERREGGVKRKRAEEEGTQERLEREIKRLAEDGRRRRLERQEMLSRQNLEEQVKADEQQTRAQQPLEPEDRSDELDRSIKVRWAREKEGDGYAIDKDQLSSLFARFGEVENVVVSKDKKKKVDGVKRLVATAFIVFHSMLGAHAAVTDMDKLKSERPWNSLEVVWASGNEPKLEIPPRSKTSQATNIPKFGFSQKLEEVTLLRLKNAEKKRLEEQIRKAEAAEQAQSAM